MHEQFLEVVTELLAIVRQDGYFQWVSRGWPRALGWTEEELTSRPWLDFVHPDDRERSRQEALDQVAGGGSARFENRYRTRDGNYRWLNWKTMVSKEDNLTYAAATDITERKAAELASEQELELHRLVEESARDFTIQVTDPEGWIQRWNPGAERIFGFSKEEAIGQKVDLIFTPEDRAAGAPAAELETALAQDCAADERWHLRKDGERVFISGMVRPLYTPERKLRGFLKIGRNITHRKKMEDELKEARENLERLVATRTAKLRETVDQLEEFSYSLVHDLRAPLRSMCSFAQLLSAEHSEQLDEQGKSYLSRIEQSSGRLDGLIRDVLTYSQVSQTPIQFQRVDLAALLTQIVSENPAFQPPQATLVWERPLLPVLAHVALLTQCIWNLLSNAVKFVRQGTRPQVRIWTEAKGEEARLWFEDNGIGIEPQHIGKIFGMFHRLHSEAEYPGTGIGLAVVRKAMERMGGTMGVESEPGKGSRFWIQMKRVRI